MQQVGKFSFQFSIVNSLKQFPHKKVNMISRNYTVYGLILALLLSIFICFFAAPVDPIYNDIRDNKLQLVRIKILGLDEVEQILSYQKSSHHPNLCADNPLVTYLLIEGIPKFDQLIVGLGKDLQAKDLNICAYIVDENGKQIRFKNDYQDTSNYFEAVGSVLNSKLHSYLFVTGYDNQNGSIKLTGFFTVDNDIYYIRPYFYHQPDSLDEVQSNYHLVSYENHLEEYVQFQNTEFIKNLQNICGSRNRQTNYNDRKYCTLKLVTDYSFYLKMGEDNSKVLLFVKYIIFIANQVFKNTIFTKSGYPNEPLQNEISHELLLSKLVIHQQPDNMFSNRSSSWQPAQYIDAIEHLSDKEYCIVHLITDLGIPSVKSDGTYIDGLSLIKSPEFNIGAFTGTNIGFTTFARYQPFQLSGIINFVHELGHIFGANHDDYKTDKNCSPNSPNGSHIMSSITISSNGPNNFKLSPCSIEEIYYTFKENSGHFVSLELCNACRDNILNKGEECDDDSHCCNQSTCKLNPGAKCSPKYNSRYCDANCQIKPNYDIYVEAEYCIDRYQTCKCDSGYHPCQICCQQSIKTFNRKLSQIPKCIAFLNLPNGELVSNGTHEGRCFDGHFVYNYSSTFIFETTTSDYPTDVPYQDDTVLPYLQYTSLVIFVVLLASIWYYFRCNERIYQFWFEELEENLNGIRWNHLPQNDDENENENNNNVEEPER